MEKSLSLYLTYDDNIYKVWTVTFNVDEKGLRKLINSFRSTFCHPAAVVLLVPKRYGCCPRQKMSK